MEYVNFYVAIPVKVYVELEKEAIVSKCTKNEIIVDAIFRRLSFDSASLNPQKNARFDNIYN